MNNRLAQVGFVTALNTEHQARVKFPDTGITSDSLYILNEKSLVINERVLVLYLPFDDSDGFILGTIP